MGMGCSSSQSARLTPSGASHTSSSCHARPGSRTPNCYAATRPRRIGSCRPAITRHVAQALTLQRFRRLATMRRRGKAQPTVQTSASHPDFFQVVAESVVKIPADGRQCGLRAELAPVIYRRELFGARTCLDPCLRFGITKLPGMPS